MSNFLYKKIDNEKIKQIMTTSQQFFHMAMAE